MAPRSVVPGRIRFESRLLIGQGDLCRSIERELASIEGILEVLANPRTGRVLVKFDEKTISSLMLTDRIQRMPITCGADGAASANPACRSGASRRGNGRLLQHPAGRFLMDMVIQTLVPKPLDSLLPVAMVAMGR